MEKCWPHWNGSVNLNRHIILCILLSFFRYIVWGLHSKIHQKLLPDVTIAFFDIAILKYLCGVCFSIIFSIATEQAGLSNYCCQFVNKTKCVFCCCWIFQLLNSLVMVNILQYQILAMENEIQLWDIRISLLFRVNFFAIVHLSNEADGPLFYVCWKSNIPSIAWNLKTETLQYFALSRINCVILRSNSIWWHQFQSFLLWRCNSNSWHIFFSTKRALG